MGTKKKKRVLVCDLCEKPKGTCIHADASSHYKAPATDYNELSLKKHLEQQYLATVHRLRQQMSRLPHVREDFMLEVASMPTEELQRRLLNVSDWVGHFNHCLDGLPLDKLTGKIHTPIEGCAQPEDIRALVEYLLQKC